MALAANRSHPGVSRELDGDGGDSGAWQRHTAHGHVEQEKKRTLRDKHARIDADDKEIAYDDEEDEDEEDRFLTSKRQHLSPFPTLSSTSSSSPTSFASSRHDFERASERGTKFKRDSSESERKRERDEERRNWENRPERKRRFTYCTMNDLFCLASNYSK